MTRIVSVLTMASALAAATLPFTSHADPAANDADLSPAALARACEGKDGWAEPAPPAHIYGNTWFVGTCGITAVLVTGKEGHVLVDGGVAKAAPLVLANIRRAGFEPKDVRWIVATHEHYDHVGALAALKAASGAKVAALPAQKAVLESGRAPAEDPQAASLEPIAPLKVERVLKDGDSVVLPGIALTAHATPVHAPGSTSWTWQACDTRFTCRMIAYADSSSTISADGYRFSDHPERVGAIRQGLPVMAALPCDILLTPHPRQSAMMERFAGKVPLVNTDACRVYVTAAEGRLAQRLRDEQGQKEQGK